MGMRNKAGTERARRDLVKIGILSLKKVKGQLETRAAERARRWWWWWWGHLPLRIPDEGGDDDNEVITRQLGVRVKIGRTMETRWRVMKENSTQRISFGKCLRGKKKGKRTTWGLVGNVLFLVLH